jgi:hypothetical protein
MRQDEVHKGLLVKLVTAYSNVPPGTWATVYSTGTMQDGTWWFMLRWRPYTAIPNISPRKMSEYSINLWKRNLAMFEVVSADEEEAVRKSKLEGGTLNRPPFPQLSGGWKTRRPSRAHPNQLSLFLSDDF